MAQYVMGVDGGGTGTVYELRDAHSEAFMLRGETGAMSPFVPEALRMTAQSLCTVMRETPGECVILRCGCAGAGEDAMAEKVKTALENAGIDCPVSVVGDHVNALDTAFGDGDGAIIIAGTGSVAYARQRGNYCRAGGRGHVFDDSGSAYAIGRDMLACVARASDGRGRASALTDIVFEAAGVGDIGALTTYYTSPARVKSDIAALARRLDEAIEQGDMAALEIAQRAAAELAVTAGAVCARLDGPQRLAMTGSVLMKNACIRGLFIERLKIASPDTEPFILEKRAETGAAQKAIELIRSKS